MTESIHYVVLALDNTYQRISRFDVICDLLKGMESGDINIDDDITSGITLMTLVVESLERAMDDAFEDCNKIQAYIEAHTGQRFSELVENARRVGLTVVPDEPGRAQS